MKKHIDAYSFNFLGGFMSEKSIFKIGDLVQLKSGGPAMTVNHIYSDGDMLCVWFAGSKDQRARFSSETVHQYTAPEKKK